MQWIPRGVKRFLTQNGIDVDWYSVQAMRAKALPRFVRVRSSGSFVWNSCFQSLSESEQKRLTANAIEHGREFLRSNGGRPLHESDDEIWTLPQTRSISLHKSYKEGILQGIDAASVLAVEALGSEPGEAVLDLCCAPGAKLLVLADRMKRRGILVGVDSSANRLTTCAGLARQYRVGASTAVSDWFFSLVHADGRLFAAQDVFKSESVKWDSLLDRAFFESSRGDKGLVQERQGEEQIAAPSPRKRISKSRRKVVVSERVAVAGGLRLEQFDKVLVDTQCTHEGSFKHMLKFLQGQEKEKVVWNADRLDALFCEWAESSAALEELQRGILLNGFQLLRPGGSLVYSTCSFCERQNEGILEWLLSQEPQARLVPLDPRELSSCLPARQSKRLHGTLYYDPVTSGTSGLFLSKLIRLQD